MVLDSILNIGGKLIDKLIPDPAAKAAAQLELARLAQEGELTKLANETKLYETEQNNLTARLTADMSSDSWLSKNIRPLTLIAILTGYFVFAQDNLRVVRIQSFHIRCHHCCHLRLRKRDCQSLFHFL